MTQPQTQHELGESLEDTHQSPPPSSPTRGSLEDPPERMDDATSENMLQERKRQRMDSGKEVRYFAKGSRMSDDKIREHLNNILNEIDILQLDSGHVTSEMETSVEAQVELTKQVQHLSNIVTKQDKLIDNLSSKCTKLEKHSMQNNIVVYNALEHNNEDPQQAVHSALASKGVSNIKLDIERAHRLGPKRSHGPRPLVARLHRQSQVSEVLKATRPLPGNRPQKGSIKFAPQTPEASRFERIKLAEYAYLEKQKDKKAEVEYRYDHIKVDGRVVKDNLVPPTAESILTRSITEDDRMGSAKFYTTEIKCEKASKFQILCSKIKTVEDAAKAYKAVHRYRSAASYTHLVSAYRTSTGEQGWADDNEHGMGKYIYGIMKEKGFNNAIVFLARDYGGYHLGPRRFTIVSELMKELREVIRIGVTKSPTEGDQSSTQDSANSPHGEHQDRGSQPGGPHHMEGNDQGTHPWVSSQERDLYEQPDSDTILQDCPAFDANFTICRPKLGNEGSSKPDFFNNTVPNQDDYAVGGDEDQSGNMVSSHQDGEQSNNPFKGFSNWRGGKKKGSGRKGRNTRRNIADTMGPKVDTGYSTEKPTMETNKSNSSSSSPLKPHVQVQLQLIPEEQNEDTNTDPNKDLPDPNKNGNDNRPPP